MVRITHEDTQTGLTLYVLLVDDTGDNIWDTTSSSWVDIYDEDNPSQSADAWLYPIALTENYSLPGSYYVDVDLANSADGWVRYTVYTQTETGADDDDKKRAAGRFYLKDGDEYEYAGLISSLASISSSTSGNTTLSRDDRRAITRAANRSRNRRER